MPPRSLKAIPLLLLLLSLACLPTTAAASATWPPPNRALLHSAYSVEETLHYDITWLGLKAGELIIRLVRPGPDADRFAIRVTARSAGLLAVFYPVEDQFETVVEGPERLPRRYTIEQHEGHRHNEKTTRYDQISHRVVYVRNGQKPLTFAVDGPVHNEFSSFLILRALPLKEGTEIMVPTFADRKRHEIKVTVEGISMEQSLFGEVRAIKVRPRLTFKGLYEKAGDPEIWLTDSPERIPIRIKARIVIGSLTATLVDYQRQQTTRSPAD